MYSFIHPVCFLDTHFPKNSCLQNTISGQPILFTLFFPQVGWCVWQVTQNSFEHGLCNNLDNYAAIPTIQSVEPHLLPKLISLTLPLPSPDLL